MARKKSGGSLGGFVFNVFNIGFTVFMFILPTIGLVYWYVYLRNPGGGAEQPQVIVQQTPVSPKANGASEPKKEPTTRPQIPTTAGFFDEPFGPAPETVGNASVDQPNDKTPARAEYETRSWSDESGKFSVQARFYSVTGDRVKIVTADQRQIEVPIDRLSEEDKAYLRSIFREKGIQPSF